MIIYALWCLKWCPGVNRSSQNIQSPFAHCSSISEAVTVRFILVNRGFWLGLVSLVFVVGLGLGFWKGGLYVVDLEVVGLEDSCNLARLPAWAIEVGLNILRCHCKANPSKWMKARRPCDSGGVSTGRKNWCICTTNPWPTCLRIWGNRPSKCDWSNF